VTGVSIRRRAAGLASLAALVSLGCHRAADRPPEPAPPLEPVAWVRPTGPTADPVWGTKDGLAVGLWPTGGPRGLIRVYAPYLAQPFPRVVNFVSIEPVVGGVRAQSELDASARDGRPGLAFWTAYTLAEATTAKDPNAPAAGRLERVGDAEALTFFLATEPFRNGARPVIEVTLRSDRPHEVGFRIHSAGGAQMDSCVLSATMGNYGRLRRLWLRGEVVDARKTWPAPTFDRLGFTPWRAWPAERMLLANGQRVAAAMTDEANPAKAAYDPAVPAHWRYQGRPATQYWRAPDAAGLVVRVNGRTTYWGNGGPIPGGLAFENFELEAPFTDGQQFWFGATPDPPAALGFDPDQARHLTGGDG
jgi:hypothetical protein